MRSSGGSSALATTLLALAVAAGAVAAAAGEAGGAAARAPGLRVLAVFPLPGRSHSIVGHSIVDILLQDGHEVTFVTPFPKATSKPGLRYIDLSSLMGEVSERELPKAWQLVQSPRPARRVLQLGPAFTQRALQHEAFQRLLRDPAERFDVVVAEWFYTGLLAPLAAVFSCPLIWYSSPDVSWQTLRLVHEASSPAYTAELQSRAAPAQPYSLLDRADQLWHQFYLGAIVYYNEYVVEPPMYLAAYGPALSARGARAPAYSALAFNASLLLVNCHPPLGQRVPLPAAVRLVGGHHVRMPPEPLPQDLQKLLDDAEQGAIFFSMGSTVKSKDLPEDMTQEILAMLGQLEQTVLWKFEGKLENVPSNVHLLEWAPQPGILNHRNTALFITHGGLLSQLEATAFGVPVIGVPLFGDQFVNVDLAVARGVALRVDLAAGFPRRLQAAVNAALGDGDGDGGLRQRARDAALQFALRPAPAAAELAHWVRAVAATRGAPHLRSPAARLPLPRRLYLDLAALALLALLALRRLLAAACRSLTQDTPPPTTDDKKRD